MVPPTPNNPDPLDIPPALARDLRALDPLPSSWPSFDALTTADLHFTAARRGRRRLILRGASLAAAAGLALAVILWPTLKSSRHAPTPATITATRIPGDLNGDGLVDMVDALILANSIQSGSPRPDGDFTGDGRIDRADVDRLAQGAVKLTGGAL